MKKITDAMRKKMIYLHRVEGLSYSTIAERFGVNSSTVIFNIKKGEQDDKNSK